MLVVLYIARLFSLILFYLCINFIIFTWGRKGEFIVIRGLTKKTGFLLETEKWFYLLVALPRSMEVEDFQNHS